MKLKFAVHCAGILALASFGARQTLASQIVVTNSGSAGASGFGYSNSYDSNSGYSSSGVGVTTTTGTTLGLTEIMLTGSVTDPNGNFGRPASASSSGYVNLGTGEIKILAATGPCYNTGVPTCDGLTNTGGTINENVTFQNNTGLAATIGFAWHVNLEVTGDATRSGVGGSTAFGALSAALSYDFANCTGSILNCSSLDGTRTGGWDSLTMTPDGNFGEDFLVTKTINPGSTSTPIFENFNLICALGASCDGSHTASLALSLPPGVTFTSESGIYLTQQSSSNAPEPGSWAMLGTGALLFGISRLRPRRCPLGR
jgi:hypothetical protein